MVNSRHIALAAIFTALGVALSLYPGAIPVGPTKVLPYQHMVNVLAGIILGPWIGAGVALAIGIIRIGMGTGSIFAIPGGIPGVLVVGLAYRYWMRKNSVGLLEPIGTGGGALISAFLVAPLAGAGPLPSVLGMTDQWVLFLIAFWASSIPGSILGFVVITALAKRGIRIPL
ncbi:MAG: energy coupling factor transporter S component ThiW [Thaumarchaeota archaeon]|nr:energy coupling factor transporter S component ThiW [Nitrososphaerota archaeon]